MYRRTLVFICKILIKLLRLLGKNGSALPGLVIEKLYLDFLTKSLKSVEKKIVLVTGTNGKTTTTKMLVAGMRGTGARVVTNSTGSNMTRGLIAALIEDMTYFGSLKPTDWFIFEMDEAYAPIFTTNLSPKLVVGLNVLRDQLDRYGEIDKTALLIQEAALKADIFVYNQLDPLLSRSATLLESQNVKTVSFGISGELSHLVANEQSLLGQKISAPKNVTDVTLLKVSETDDLQTVLIDCEHEKYQTTIPLKGFHNALNALAVTAAVDYLKPEKLRVALEAISNMATPFGRGEKLHLKGKSITVALVKNPSGFASNLETFVKQMKPQAVLFVVNDKFADGRDVSWLWDVQFKGFVHSETKLFTSGVRGYDMALRLKHDGLVSNTTVSVPSMIEVIMKSDYDNVVIIPTYTALFEVRSALSKYGKVPRIW